MDTYLLWGLGLLGASLLLVILELFIPSGGLIAVVAGLCAIAGVVALGIYDIAWGAIGALVVLVLTPVVFFGGLNIWQNTKIGQRVIGAPTPEEVEARRAAEQAARDERLALIGAEGVALTDLRPIGVVRVDGKRLDAAAESHHIDSGSTVKIVHVDGLQIKVREVPAARA